MGKKSTPAAPDYTAAAEKTAQASKENLTDQTWANRANQQTPWGSQSWSAEAMVDPATGKPTTQWTQTTELDPNLQHALDSQLSLQSGRSDLANSLFPRAQQEFGAAMDWSGLPAWAGAPQGGELNPTTNAFGFGPQQQNINTGLSQVPQLNTDVAGSAGNIQRGLNFGGLQNVDNSGISRQRAEDAIYQSATSRLDPQFAERQRDLETDLANRGITQGSSAYSRAMDDFSRSRNDAYSQAQMQAITGAGAEAQRNSGMDLALRQQQVGEIGQGGAFANSSQQQLYNQLLGNNQALQAQNQMGSAARDQQLQAQQAAYQQSLGSGQFGLQQQQQAFGQNQAAGGQNFQQQLQAAQFQNTQRQQQLAEQMQQRGFSLNEINAIISGQQVNTPQFSGYNQAGIAQAPDYMGAAGNQYQASLDASNAQNQGWANLLGAGAQLGSAYMFSDRRLKKNIRRIGTDARGFGIYRYSYIGERGARVGVIAQEVRKKAPELVRDIGGILAVNFTELGVAA